MIEIFIINLKEGTREEFHHIFVTQSLPLLKKWNINVIAHGRSLHDENTYYVIRLFKSLEDRQTSEDAFYGSEDWKNGPREGLVPKIDSSSTIVIPTDNINSWIETIKG